MCGGKPIYHDQGTSQYELSAMDFHDLCLYIVIYLQMGGRYPTCVFPVSGDGIQLSVRSLFVRDH